jgi:hypothetical protein
MRFGFVVASVLAVAEAQCQTGNCGVQQVVQAAPVQQVAASPALCTKDKNCCRPEKPAITPDPPKPQIKPHNTWTIKKITTQPSPVEFTKRIWTLEEEKVPCMFEAEVVHHQCGADSPAPHLRVHPEHHDHHCCHTPPLPEDYTEDVKIFEWSVDLLMLKETVYKKECRPIRIILEKEKPEVDHFIVIKPKFTVSDDPDVKVKCCTPTLQDSEIWEDCSEPPPQVQQATCNQPSCMAQPACATGNCR